MTMQIYPDLIPIFLQRVHGFCAFLTHSFAKLHLINCVWNFDYNFRRFGRNYRKNYRKPIYRDYRKFIVIEKNDLSPTSKQDSLPNIITGGKLVRCNDKKTHHRQKPPTQTSLAFFPIFCCICLFTFCWICLWHTGHFQVHVSITGAEWWVVPNDREKSGNYER